MKKLVVTTVVVFALLIVQGCITVKGALELVEDQKVENLSQQNETLTQQVTVLQQKCNNLAVSLSQINSMLPVESTLADGKVIYQEVNRVLAGNGYPQLQRQVVVQPIQETD